MDKDLKSLVQAIEKVVASDHRIRDKLSNSRQVDDSADQRVDGTTEKGSLKHAD